jgi:hypothetical protein
MSTADSDRAFAGSLPKIYDTYLVPLIVVGDGSVGPGTVDGKIQAHVVTIEH